jgi:hypothetical protein
MPTPSIIDENHRSRPSPGVSGDEDSHQLGEVSRTERSGKKEEDRKERNFSGAGPTFATWQTRRYVATVPLKL